MGTDRYEDATACGAKMQGQWHRHPDPSAMPRLCSPRTSLSGCGRMSASSTTQCLASSWHELRALAFPADSGQAASCWSSGSSLMRML